MTKSIEELADELRFLFEEEAIATYGWKSNHKIPRNGDGYASNTINEAWKNWKYCHLNSPMFIKGWEAGKRLSAAIGGEREPFAYHCKAQPGREDLNDDELEVIVWGHMQGYLDNYRADGYTITPLYTSPPLQVKDGAWQKIAEGLTAEREEIKAAIHWPECWDTACYDTLGSAMGLLYECFKAGSHECHKPAAPSNEALVNEADKG